MIIIYKNKEILVPVFLLVSLIFAVRLNAWINPKVSNFFNYEFSFQIAIGFGLLLAGLWTKIKSKDFIIANGVKEEVYFENHFFIFQ